MRQPHLRMTTLLLTLGALVMLPALAGAQDAEQSGGMDPAAMEAMIKAGTPGDQHRFLARMEGDWTLTNTMWMDPSQPPMKSEGTAKKTMILDGRYLQEEVTGEAMGMTFTGRGITGYDNTAGEFVGTWIDSMATGIAFFRGQREGDTMTSHGEYLDPVSKQTMKIRAVVRIVDEDLHVFEYYMTMPGTPEFKSMVIEYARKASE